MSDREPLDFVGIGAARSGTTWLARCLAEHPDIFVPARKELHYFNSDRRYEPSLRSLRRRFRDAGPGQLRGEFTPRYIISDKALRRIQEHCPTAKILVALRNPVDRAFSQFCYFRLNKKKEHEIDFAAAVDGTYHEDYVVKSQYATQLRRVYEHFGRSRVCVVLFDDVQARPLQTLQSVFDFLGVDPTFRPSCWGRRINSSRGRHRPARAAWARSVGALSRRQSGPIRLVRPVLMPLVGSGNRLVDRVPALQGPDGDTRLDDELRTRLYARFFKDDVEETERLLGVDLSLWKDQATKRRSN